VTESSEAATDVDTVHPADEAVVSVGELPGGFRKGSGHVNGIAA
jgi:hypothetical protein